MNTVSETDCSSGTYSLRHCYAVNALRSGVGVFEVARNMGTSIQMIQEYYGKQAISADKAGRLRFLEDSSPAQTVRQFIVLKLEPHSSDQHSC